MAFKAVKRAFKGHQVERHAQPLWLFPQHLDVFISDIDLAIEYMGLQHYEPVDIFGGAVGFAATVARDRKKKELCEKSGVRLEYVKFDQDIEIRIREIVAAISGSQG